MFYYVLLCFLMPLFVWFYYEQDKKEKKRLEKQNMDELKQEVVMDEHKISIEDLLSRLKTNAETGLTESQVIINYTSSFVSNDNNYNSKM